MKFKVVISYTRPKFEGVEFLKIYHVKSKRDKEYVTEVMKKAFAEAHPSWTIKQIKVSEE